MNHEQINWKIRKWLLSHYEPTKKNITIWDGIRKGERKTLSALAQYMQTVFERTYQNNPSKMFCDGFYTAPSKMHDVNELGLYCMFDLPRFTHIGNYTGTTRLNRKNHKKYMKTQTESNRKFIEKYLWSYKKKGHRYYINPLTLEDGELVIAYGLKLPYINEPPVGERSNIDASQFDHPDNPYLNSDIHFGTCGNIPAHTELWLHYSNKYKREPPYPHGKACHSKSVKLHSLLEKDPPRYTHTQYNVKTISDNKVTLSRHRIEIESDEEPDEESPSDSDLSSSSSSSSESGDKVDLLTETGESDEADEADEADEILDHGQASESDSSVEILDHGQASESDSSVEILDKQTWQEKNKHGKSNSSSSSSSSSNSSSSNMARKKRKFVKQYKPIKRILPVQAEKKQKKEKESHMIERRKSNRQGKARYTEAQLRKSVDPCTEYDYLDWSKFGKVNIATSGIVNAGYGVFATVNYRKGDVITEYSGNVMRQMSTHRSHDAHVKETNWKIRGYTYDDLQDRNYQHISNYTGQLANDARNSEQNNAQRLDIQKECVKVYTDNINQHHNNINSRMFLVATKNIRSDTEIYSAYSETFWDHHYANRR